MFPAAPLSRPPSSLLAPPESLSPHRPHLTNVNLSCLRGDRMPIHMPPAPLRLLSYRNLPRQLQHQRRMIRRQARLGVTFDRPGRVPPSPTYEPLVHRPTCFPTLSMWLLAPDTPGVVPPADRTTCCSAPCLWPAQSLSVSPCCLPPHHPLGCLLPPVAAPCEPPTISPGAGVYPLVLRSGPHPTNTMPSRFCARTSSTSLPQNSPLTACGAAAPGE